MREDQSREAGKASGMRYSVSSLLLLMVVVALFFSLMIVYRQLREVEKRLAAVDAKLLHAETAVLSVQPIPPQEVAKQFESRTSNGSVKTTVSDVRYSPKEDAYQVEFSWIDPATKSNWTTDIRLKSDGFGRYFGSIRSDEYLKAIASNNDTYLVVVESASPLEIR